MMQIAEDKFQKCSRILSGYRQPSAVPLIDGSDNQIPRGTMTEDSQNLK